MGTGVVAAAPAQYSLSTGWIAASIVVVAFAIAYPLALAITARRKLRVSWRYFGWGALIFFLFQLVTRVPAVTVAQAALAPRLQASKPLLFAWLALLAITAGLFEEWGRYVGYRWLMRREEKTWSKAVMYGLGHGGLESFVLVGGLTLLTLVNLIALSALGPALVPAAQQAAVAKEFAAIHAQPGWLPLLAAWERLWTLPIQVALSVIVLQAFRRGGLRWVWLAVLAHTVVDGTTVFAQQLLPKGTGTLLLIEGMVALFGLAALWTIWSLRDAPKREAPIEQPAAQVAG